MRKIGWLVVMFLCWTSHLHAQQTITVVFEEWPPYEYTQGNKVVGIDTEVLEEACRRIGVTPQFRSLPWARALKQVKVGMVRRHVGASGRAVASDDGLFHGV